MFTLHPSFPLGFLPCSSSFIFPRTNSNLAFSLSRPLLWRFWQIFYFLSLNPWFASDSIRKPNKNLYMHIWDFQNKFSGNQEKGIVHLIYPILMCVNMWPADCVWVMVWLVGITLSVGMHRYHFIANASYKKSTLLYCFSTMWGGRCDHLQQFHSVLRSIGLMFQTFSSFTTIILYL